MVNDIGKLAVLLVALVGGLSIIALALMKGDTAALTVGVGIVGPVIGYVTGNGVLAARGEAPSPVIVPTNARLTSKLVAEAVGQDRLDQLGADQLQGDEPLDLAGEHTP